jgi:hypothetical protein
MSSKRNAPIIETVAEVPHPGALLASLRKGAVLAVWTSAIQNNALVSAMTSRDWPVMMLELQPPGKSWHLKPRFAADSAQEIGGMLRAACSDPPSGNVHAFLGIRDYSDALSVDGSLEWWNGMARSVSNAMVRAFVDAIVELLRRAESEKLRLLVEEVSVVVSHDAKASLATLTPTLHADQHYGPWGAALLSICGDIHARNGTIFAPTLCMEDVWHLRPIKLKDLSAVVDENHLYRARSGDLALYSGMKDERGSVNRGNGIPHISPDFPGSGARLVVLLRSASEVRIR